MSRVECGQCGARYELSVETNLEGDGAARSVTHCRECGASVDSSPEDRVTPPMPLGVPERSALEGADGDGPATTRSPAPLADAFDDDGDGIFAGDQRDTVSDSPKDEPARSEAAPKVSGEEPLEQSPESGLPVDSIEYLDDPPAKALPNVPPRRRPEADERAPDSASFLTTSPESRRPEIRVDTLTAESNGPGASKAEAPVAGTKPPPAKQAPDRSGVTGLLLALPLAGAYFGARSLRGGSEPAPAARATEAPTHVEASQAATGDTPALPVDALIPPPPMDEPVTTTPEPGAAPVARAERRNPSANVVPASFPAKPAGATERAVGDNPPPAGDTAFDAGAANQALADAASRASSCRKAADPSGVATVTITFSPSGRVTTANISGPPFAGTETGSCIASTFRSARVPAFAGDFMTVKKTVAIQ